MSVPRIPPQKALRRAQRAHTRPIFVVAADPGILRIDLPMTRTLSILGWIFIAIDLVGAAALIFGRDSGDAATRGLGHGLGTALAALGALAARLLWAGRAPERTLLVVVGTVIASAPVVLGVTLTVSRNGLALIYPSMRD